MEATRLPVADLVTEALAGLLQRPARSLLTMLGTVLGIGSFVAILGLTASAGGQVDKRFTILAATGVTVQDVGSGNPDDVSLSFTADAADRVQALNGVERAGVLWKVQQNRVRITTSPFGATVPGGNVDLVAMSPEALAAMHPVLRTGRSFDRFHTSRQERVAVLGEGAATALGISRIDGFPAVFVNGAAYTVIGIIDDFRRRPDLTLAIMIPHTTALTAYGPPVDQRAEMVIETRVGAAPLVAKQAALALRPEAPERFKVIPPPDPKGLRDDVTSDINTLFLVLAAISLVIGAVGIANTTLVAVLERTNEIGLRRSLGARPIHVAAQFLAESTALGLLGGLVGSTLGVTVVVVTALAQEWTAILAPWTLPAAPAIGAVVGLLSGLYPALRAAWLQPVEALRR